MQLCADAAQGQAKGARTVAILPKVSSKLGSRVALVQLPLLLQRDRLTFKSAPIVAQHVVLLSISHLQR